jgi:hypothetical protein
LGDGGDLGCALSQVGFELLVHATAHVFKLGSTFDVG